MKIPPMAIPEMLLITPTRHGDARGWFSETFPARALNQAGFTGGAFVQDNHPRDAAAPVLAQLDTSFTHGKPA